jgi:hypothetical protein
MTQIMNFNVSTKTSLRTIRPICNMKKDDSHFLNTNYKNPSLQYYD